MTQLPHSRRHFLLRCAAAVGASAAVLSCRRETGGDPVPPSVGVARPHRPPAEEEVPSCADVPSAEPMMRVRLARREGRPATLECAGRWIELRCPDPHDATGRGAPMAILLSPVQVARNGDQWQITDAWGFRPALPPGATPQLQPLLKARGGSEREPTPARSAVPSRSAAKAAGGLLHFEETAYPGALRVVSTGDSSFDLVNHVPLEQYLPGVLARELYRHWHSETYAAQAIAARSFACHEHDFFSLRRHYDVTNDAATQVYGGDVGHERAREAAQRTSGVVLGYRGRLVPGYYSSCCGGRAAVASDVMGSNSCNELPPLRGRTGHDACTGAPVYNWSIERPLAEVMERLRGWGRANRHRALAEMPRLLAIEVDDVNTHGRSIRFRLVFEEAGGLERAGAVSLEAEKLRRALDWSGSGRGQPKPSMYSSCFTAEITETSVHFTGHGYGHGVGMCQYGAQALAQRGEPYDAILRWYYPDVELTRAYGLLEKEPARPRVG